MSTHYIHVVFCGEARNILCGCLLIHVSGAMSLDVQIFRVNTVFQLGHLHFLYCLSCLIPMKCQDQ